jgi:hypothetical protein
VNHIHGSRAPISQTVARRVIELFHDFRPPEKADHKGTPHQVGLVGLLMDGHT